MEKLLVGLHVVLLVAALVATWLPSAAAGAPEAGAPLPGGRRRWVVAGVLLVVAAGMAFVGSARSIAEVGMVGFVAQTAGTSDVRTRCDAATGIGVISGSAQDAPCTVEIAGQTLPAALTSDPDGTADVSIPESVVLPKLAQHLTDGAAREGVQVSADCGHNSYGALIHAPAGTEITAS